MGTSHRRAALVTGGSSGIGRAVAAALLSDGWAVTICGRSAERLDAAAGELGSADDLFPVVADVTEPSDVPALLEAHERRFGRLDALVLSAGAVDLGGIGDGSVDRLDEPLAHLDRDAMIAPEDIGETVRYLTRLGPTSSVPEILMLQTHDRLLAI